MALLQGIGARKQALARWGDAGENLARQVQQVLRRGTREMIEAR
jgi:hypothetical protein